MSERSTSELRPAPENLKEIYIYIGDGRESQHRDNERDRDERKATVCVWVCVCVCAFGSDLRCRISFTSGDMALTSVPLILFMAMQV